MERGGLNECVIRIDIHERESFGIGSRALSDGFGNGPEPCGVHVRVTNHAEISSGAVACAFFESGSEAFRYFLAGGVNFFVGRASDILNKVGESVDESLMSLHGSIVFAGKT